MGEVEGISMRVLLVFAFVGLLAAGALRAEQSKADNSPALKVIEMKPDPNDRGKIVELEIAGVADEPLAYLVFPADIFDPPLKNGMARPYVYVEIKMGNGWERYASEAFSGGTKATEIKAKAKVRFSQHVALPIEAKAVRFGMTFWKVGDISGDKRTVWSGEHRLIP
jgi:hypothetical protein